MQVLCILCFFLFHYIKLLFFPLCITYVQINKLHPNKEVRVSIYPSSPPSFELTDDAVEASVAITIELLVVEDDDDDATSTSHVVSVKTVSFNFKAFRPYHYSDS